MAMDKNRKFVLEAKIGRVIKALAQNRMAATYAPTKEDAVKAVEALLNDGETISCGGSMTLQECGVRALMESGRYNFIDREKISPREAYLKTFGADVFLTSANAITEDGELYNVDGNGNRVAALIYGPKRVIVVAGYNKIVRNLDEAILRVKTVAAPANGARLETRTPCSRMGRCSACDGGMTAGCASERRMCSHYVITGYQRADRIQVILVGEELGY